MEYWTIEVMNGELSALRWRDAYGDALVEAAYASLVLDWQWTIHPWGVALQLEFGDEEHWLRFRALPVVRAVLDAVPDRVSGVLIYPGPGGSAGASMHRRTRPAPICTTAAAAVPVPRVQLDVAARLEPTPSLSA